MLTQFHPFPVLQTERLTLRVLSQDDDHEIMLQRSNPQIQELVEVVDARSVEYARYFIRKILESMSEGACVYWAITLKNAPKLIGTICLWNLSLEHASAELGYSLHPDFQGNGYMQESVKRVEDFGFNIMKAHTIIAYPHVKNAASVRLLEKCGYVADGLRGDCLVYYKNREFYYLHR